MTEATKPEQGRFSAEERLRIVQVLDLADRRVAERDTIRAELSTTERRRIDKTFSPYLGGSEQRSKLIEVFGEQIFYGRGNFREHHSPTLEAWCVRAMSFAKEIAERMRHKMDELGMNGALEDPRHTQLTKDTLEMIVFVLEDIDSITLGWNYSPTDARGVDGMAENPWLEERSLRLEQSKNWKRSLLKHKKIGQFMGFNTAFSWNAITDGRKQIDPMQIAVMMLIHDVGRAVSHDRFAHEHIQHVIFEAVGIPNEFIHHYELDTEDAFLDLDFQARDFIERVGEQDPQKIIFHFCDIFSKTEDPIEGTVLGKFSTDYLRQQVRWYLEGRIEVEKRSEIIERWLSIFNQYPKPVGQEDTDFVDRFFMEYPDLQKSMMYYINESKFVYEALEWFKRKGVALDSVHTATQEYINREFSSPSSLSTAPVRV